MSIVPGNEADAAARACAGDFDRLYRQWYAPLVRLARRMLRDSAEAEEVVQDVMLSVWQRGGLGLTGASPEAYLFQATRNRTLNRLRRARLEERAVPYLASAVTHTPSVLHDVVSAELGALASHGVRALPPRCREVFELSRLHGMSHGDIARRLDITVKAVEANIGRALRALRAHLAPHVGDADAGVSTWTAGDAA